MHSQTLFVAALVAAAEARFGAEQRPVAAIAALTNRGKPGDAGTLSGQVPGVLLAGANACAKLTLADTIITTLGSTPDVVSAAAALVAAEKNFNPFAVSIPSLCSDVTLPVTEVLRGIVPLIDPAVVGSDIENANSASSLLNPFAAGGLSVADVVAANGFTNFSTQAVDGSTGAAAVSVTAALVTAASTATASAAATTLVTSVVAASASSVASVGAAGAASSTGAAGPVVNGVQQSTIAGLDFGLCVPTIKFEAGLDGRKATEFTFQAIDPLVNKGQEEALNPNIITKRISDQLTNVCNANQAAKDAAKAAVAQISALGTKDQSTADAWNTALGFAGTNTNPDNAPQPGLVGHT
ncbi:uncharacterized protein SPSK_03479 [Sporothrix schenckii 1099-18]|uniref:Uncharacterized protein n=2 Tax=Sporothrix schenckii TaxID=29908 RepID=U7PSB2_SPOS1|nr:uncharacterized protein SPSK_03479 [Sporothrix schenckii 1099-18]ERS97841.1 hypothetical protein HMPREF1624_06012 [Sporothrix schenckii ATCC 58251]KJR82406.1 hypothetical protein SPSK_03479 [Sporothrix schenckii 1099-18]